MYIHSIHFLQEDEEDATGCFEYVMHGLTLPWKLAFALIPPTDYAGGWICFVVSIVAIGAMTALIGDFASAFGCTVRETAQIWGSVG